MDFVSHFSDEETESHQNKIICSRSQSVSAGWGIQAPIYMWQVNTLVPSLLQNVGGQRSPGGIYGEDHQKSSLYTSKVTLLVHWETIIWTDVYLSQKYVHSPIIGIVCTQDQGERLTMVTAHFSYYYCILHHVVRSVCPWSTVIRSNSKESTQRNTGLKRCGCEDSRWFPCHESSFTKAWQHPSVSQNRICRRLGD